jgi:hypothetical protein
MFGVGFLVQFGVRFRLSNFAISLTTDIRAAARLRGRLHVRFRLRIGVRFGVRFATKRILKVHFEFFLAEMCRQTIVMGVR